MRHSPSSIAAQGIERFAYAIDDPLHLGQIAMAFVADKVQASCRMRSQIDVEFPQFAQRGMAVQALRQYHRAQTRLAGEYLHRKVVGCKYGFKVGDQCVQILDRLSRTLGPA